MRILIRRLLKTAKGVGEYQDLELQTDALTIGRAADQLLYLPGSSVALRHLRLIQKGDKTLLQATGSAPVQVNGAEVDTATLVVGDVVVVGAHTLTVIRPPTGFAMALEVVEAPVEDSGANAGSRYGESLETRKSAVRTLSWLLLLLVAVFSVALPLVDNLLPVAHKALLKAGIPFSNFWSSGPLASVHHNSKAVFDCHACHKTPFEPVANDTCIDCHKFAGNHVHPDHRGFPMADGLRCGGCHDEHNEPEKLVRVDETQCVSCHGDIRSQDPATTLSDVRHFETAHPSFKVTVPLLKDDKTWTEKRINLAELKKDPTTLKFNHEVHLKDEGILTPEGRKVMECADCHQPDESGWYMKPMTMEKTCRSCHALTFDEDDPERQVPHGDPKAVRQELQEYYLNKFSQPATARDVPAASRRHGRPGHERETAFECKGAPLDCARVMTDRSMTDLFERTACYTCHQVSSDPAADPGYQVKPVKLVNQWMHQAKFTHADHMTEDCSRCHDAKTSRASEDLMIPDIDNCRECHGGEGSWGKLNSTCISCHEFHFDDRGYMGRSAILETPEVPREDKAGVQ